MHALVQDFANPYRVRLIHFQPPGRARFAVEGLKRNPSLKALIEGRLCQSAEVVRISANPLTGNVLVHFEGGSPEAITARLEAIVEAALPPRPAATPAKASSRPTLVHSAPPPPSSTSHWHAMGEAELLQEIAAPEAEGLSSAEAASRLAHYGPNALGEHKPRSQILMFLEQFQSLPVGLLGVSAVVSLMTGGAVDAVVIMGVTVINAVIGYTTERQAERIIGSLADNGPRMARVVRDGEALDLPARDLVPGDRLLLSPGAYVPADLRLVEARRLTVDESALTGESMPVEKRAGVELPLDAPLGDRHNMAHMGTTVTGGSGVGIAVATGGATEIGHIQALIGEARPPDTPMQRQLDGLGTQLALISGAVCLGVFGVGLLRGYSLMEMMKASISLAVAAIPEGLPTVATTTLALGIREMRKRQVAVRHLDAVETLGSVQTFCLDKTGTLTRNTMSLVAVHCGLEQVSLAEDGLYIAGQRIELSEHHALRRLLEVVVLCNESEAGGDGEPVVGSSTETALLLGAMAAGIEVAPLRRELPRSSVQYRSEGRPYMKTVHRLADGRQLIAVKGSPSSVLAMCDQMQVNGTCSELDDDIRAALLAGNETMAADALRVLGVAYVEIEAGASHNGQRLTWLGLVGMADPLRSGVAGLMREFHRAGVNTVMITGDQSATAYAIGKQLNLANDGELKILDSTALEKMDPALLAGLVRNVHVFARVSPANKLMIVQALQQAGQVVAMTGDGVNDGPALKAADIGVAMGGSGTDVARSVADVVVEDDNLHTMVEAIRQGRTIYANIRKSIHYLLATNLSEIEVMLAGIAFGMGSPLTPMQLLWINLISDIFPGLALSLEAPEKDVLSRPPRDPNEPIVRNRDLARVGIEATMLTAGTMGAFGYGLLRYGPGPRAGTHAFTTLALGQLLHAYVARSDRHTVFEPSALPPNHYLSAAIGGSIALQLLAMLIPGLRRLLGVTPISLLDGAVIGAGAVGPLVVNELIKTIRQPARPALIAVGEPRSPTP